MGGGGGLDLSPKATTGPDMSSASSFSLHRRKLYVFLVPIEAGWRQHLSANKLCEKDEKRNLVDYDDEINGADFYKCQNHF